MNPCPRPDRLHRRVQDGALLLAVLLATLPMTACDRPWATKPSTPDEPLSSIYGTYSGNLVGQTSSGGSERIGMSLVIQESGVAVSVGGYPLSVSYWKSFATSVVISAAPYHFNGTRAGNVITGTYYGSFSSGTWSVTR